EQAAQALVAGIKRRCDDPPWPSAVWDAVIDLTSIESARLAWVRTLGSGGPASIAAKNGLTAAWAQLRDAILAQVPGLDPKVCRRIARWLEQERIYKTDRSP